MSGHQAYRYDRYDRPLAEKRAERASGGLPGCGPTSQTSVTLRVNTVYGRDWIANAVVSSAIGVFNFAVFANLTRFE